MFCSHCGKKIEDGSAFCSGCGKATGNGQSAAAPVQKVVYVKQVKNHTIAGNAEEVKIKTAVLGMYVVGALLQIIFFLVVISSKFGIIAEQIVLENYLLDSVVNQYFEKMYDELQVVIWFFFISILVGIVFDGIGLWKNCVDRNLANNRKRIIVDSVGTAICCFVVTVGSYIIALQSADNLKVSFSALYWTVLFGILIYKAIYNIIYLKAIKLETSNVFKENRRTTSANYWICGYCKTKNDNKDLLCKECGRNYKGIDEKQGWKCKNCNMVNDKNDDYCKSCGKYR